MAPETLSDFCPLRTPSVLEAKERPLQPPILVTAALNVLQERCYFAKTGGLTAFWTVQKGAGPEAPTPYPSRSPLKGLRW